MILLQTLSNAITKDGAVSGDYALGLAFGVIGFLLVAVATLVGNYFISTLKGIKVEIQNIHTRVDSREKEHDDLSKEHEKTRMEVLLIKNRMEIQGDKIAMQVVNKLRSIKPGFYDNENEE